MFDYKAWIEEAERFTNGIKLLQSDFAEVRVSASLQPPLDEQTLQEIIGGVGVHVPKELQNFWTQAARNCNFYYFCSDAKSEMQERMRQVFGDNGSIWGGARFSDPLDLAEHLQDCDDWGGIFEEYPDFAQAALWFNALPFQAINTGDFLGLDISTKHDDPAVIYLSHDGESQIIAPSFTSFLQNWADLCYFGPESWMIELFQAENGFLDATSSKAAVWREMLRSGL